MSFLPLPPSPSSPPQPDPAAVLQAFKNSGYYNSLDANYQKQAESDPNSWLNSHPYLFDNQVYSSYFAPFKGYSNPAPTVSSPPSPPQVTVPPAASQPSQQPSPALTPVAPLVDLSGDVRLDFRSPPSRDIVTKAVNGDAFKYAGNAGNEKYIDLGSIAGAGTGRIFFPTNARQDDILKKLDSYYSDVGSSKAVSQLYSADYQQAALASKMAKDNGTTLSALCILR